VSMHVQYHQLQPPVDGLQAVQVQAVKAAQLDNLDAAGFGCGGPGGAMTWAPPGGPGTVPQTHRYGHTSKSSTSSSLMLSTNGSGKQPLGPPASGGSAREAHDLQQPQQPSLAMSVAAGGVMPAHHHGAAYGVTHARAASSVATATTRQASSSDSEWQALAALAQAAHTSSGGGE
jgi:hypothetical protein